MTRRPAPEEDETMTVNPRVEDYGRVAEALRSEQCHDEEWRSECDICQKIEKALAALSRLAAGEHDSNCECKFKEATEKVACTRCKNLRRMAMERIR